MKNNIMLVTLAAAASSLPVQAALYGFQSGDSLVPGNSLAGTVSYQGWDRLTTVRIDNNPAVPGDNSSRPYGYHNLTSAWANTIPSNLGTGTSTLHKSGGYGYIAGGSLHQGASTGAILPGGTFSITSSAISGLETLVFLIQATDRGGQVFSEAPTLRFGAEILIADYTALYATEVINGMGGPQNKNSYAFQWDLSNFDITAGEEMKVNWTGLANSGIHELQVNQGNAFAQVVPEPSSALLGVAALGLIFIRRRRHA